MTLAHDADTRWPAAGGDSTAGDRTFTHTPAGTPAGVAVVLVSNLLVAAATGILYGTEQMALVATGINTNEDGLVEVYTLTDVAVPAGAQTVTIQGATTASKMATCSTVTATGGRTTVNVAAHKDNSVGTNPSITLNTSKTTISYGGYEHGDANPLATPAAGCTAQHSIDYGAKVAGTSRRTSPDAAGAIVLGWTFATSEDYTMAAAALAEVVVVALGQAAETEAAQAVAVRRNVPLGQVVETETAQGFTVGSTGQTIPVGQATETETAQPVTVRRDVALGLSVESETAQTLAVRRNAAAGQVQEAESAQAFTSRKTQVLGQVVEPELAQTVAAVEHVVLGQVVEVEAAQPVTVAGTTTAPLAQVVETETAQPFAIRRMVGLGQVVEVESAAGLVAAVHVPIGMVIEIESALAMVVVSGTSRPRWGVLVA